MASEWAGELPDCFLDDTEGEHGTTWAQVDMLRECAGTEAIEALRATDFRVRRFHQARERMFDEVANVLEQFLAPRDTICQKCGGMYRTEAHAAAHDGPSVPVPEAPSDGRGMPFDAAMLPAQCPYGVCGDGTLGCQRPECVKHAAASVPVQGEPNG